MVFDIPWLEVFSPNLILWWYKGIIDCLFNMLSSPPPKKNSQEEERMKIIECVPQRFYKTILSLLVLAGAVSLFILGITLLPVLGILLSLPTFAIAYYIFNLDLNDKCEIKVSWGIEVKQELLSSWLIVWNNLQLPDSFFIF